MDRRKFFQYALRKATKSVVKKGDAVVTARAGHWIRPPYAIAELEFLLACSRCADCIEACPHDVLFPLAARLGAGVAGTPALDLLHKGCRLCEDWPCVNACETGALQREPAPAGVKDKLPVLARVTIDTATCLPYLGPECGVCVEACPVPGALTLQQERPVIDDTLCTGCAMCREVCIVEGKAIRVSSLYATHGEEQE
jgi:ferredoxin-type protein NapG